MTNIKVDRLLLIKALEAEQKKLTEQFKRDMEKFRKAEEEYPGKLVTALEQMTARAKKGILPRVTTSSSYHNGKYVQNIVVEGLVERPTKPTKDRKTCDLERQIRTLEMCKDETIRVNENSEYVKFVCAI